MRTVGRSLSGLLAATVAGLLLIDTHPAARQGAAPRSAPPAATTPSAPPRTSTAQPATPVAASGPAALKPTLNRYCVTCHSDRLKTGGLTLQSLDLTDLSAHAGTWEKVIRKVNAGMMPPAGMPRPEPARLTELTGTLEAALDREAAIRPRVGPAALHRLNRNEYANAIRDLLALDVDVEALLPPDDAVAGFDNIAEALGVSPALLERYLAAALKIAPTATGTYTDGAVESTYLAPGDYSQIRHVQGLPFGTRGGLLIDHTFPVDGEYVIRALLWRNNAGRIRGLEAPHQLEILVDGERVHQVTVGTPEHYTTSFIDRENTRTTAEFDATLQVRVKVKAGPRKIGVTFAGKTAALDPQKLRPLLSPYDAVDTHGVPRVDRVMITGPYNPSGPGDTPSRARIFVCRPSTGAGRESGTPGSAAAQGEEPCARRIMTQLAERAYRRPVVAADVDPLMAFFRTGRAEANSFDVGIERAITRLLTSPAFIFRSERGEVAPKTAALASVADLELASRLSFFLWSSIPDDALRQAGAQGRLGTRAAIEQQVKRMLADPRSSALAENFAGQWLYLRNLKNFLPIADDYPDFDDDLRQAFKRETELLFDAVLHEERSILELLTADFTHVNERLAHHYRIPGVYGSHFRRVPVRDENRRGLIGHGSILTVTSNANRTSPVRRGKWILENVIGSAPPPPPLNVPALTENRDRPKPLTMRQQMEQHRANPACASCHKLMDPLGFALENFDAVGGWRAKDSGTPIDAKVEMGDGTAVEGAAGLRQLLARRPELFARTVTEKLLTYALGRPLEAFDMPAVRKIVKDAAPQNYRFSALVTGVATSVPFTMRPNDVVTDAQPTASAQARGAH